VPPEKLHFLLIYWILGRHIATVTLWDVRLHIPVFSFSEISHKLPVFVAKVKKMESCHTTSRYISR
jgi:hypothetical protein